MKVFIWGTRLAASYARLALRKDVNLRGYIDNNNENWGLEVLGKQIFSPEILLLEDYDYVIIGAYAGYCEISRQLEEMGVNTDKIIQLFNYTKLLPLAFFYNEKYINEELYKDVFGDYVSIRMGFLF